MLEHQKNNNNIKSLIAESLLKSLLKSNQISASEYAKTLESIHKKYI